MSLPEIPGYRIETLIGKGACGTVYTARHDSGNEVAVKLLNPKSVNAELLANRVNRLYSASPPKATVPLIAHSLEKEPYLLIGGLMADRMPQGVAERFIPRTLQLQLNDYMGNRSSWMLIRRLAQVLADFHRRRVAHGNLKPGNIFLDSDNGVLLSDYAQGLMPGLEELAYTDALLYAPPEQLLNPDGYLEGAGYGWDVYAFGSLAYRLLTGVFPRCNDSFEHVSPLAGEQRRRGVEADCERMAQRLERARIAKWKGVAPTREEEEGRLVIERCLHLDAWKRYGDMREVLRDLESIANARQQRLSAEEGEKRVKVVERRQKSWQAATGVGIAACVTLGAALIHKIARQERPEPKVVEVEVVKEVEAGSEVDPKELEEQRQKFLDMLADRDELELANEEQAAAVREMANDLMEAHKMSDHLLAWSLERGSEHLPTLEGREGRLSLLEDKLERQLEVVDELPEELRKNSWRIKLALAEVALAGDKPKLAREKMQEVLGEAAVTDVDVQRRLARTRVMVCLLGSEDSDTEVTPVELAETANALASLPENERQTRRLQSALNIAEARMQFRNGDNASALETYRNAFAKMSKLCEEKPSLSALRIWRARGYSSAAQAATGAGEVDAAILLREQAAVELMELLETQPDRADVQVELSSALAAIAQSALEEGELDRAGDLATRSLELLETAVSNPEERGGALNQLASLKSVLAACRAGTGHPREALRLVREGQEHAEAALVRNSRDPSTRFRLGILAWQQCGLLSAEGKHAEALPLGVKARQTFIDLIAQKVSFPTQREIKRSLAYLTGDLGRSAQDARKEEEAVNYLQESVSIWEDLMEAESDSDEFREQHRWTAQGLRELGIVTALPQKKR
jgi:tetratricopeptide (TPR) repeat protein